MYIVLYFLSLCLRCPSFRCSLVASCNRRPALCGNLQILLLLWSFWPVRHIILILAASLHFAPGAAEAKCILVTRVCVCLSVCLSVAAFPHYCTDPDVFWGNGRACPLAVHCWADLQSVHGFRWYDNIAPNAKCQ